VSLVTNVAHDFILINFHIHRRRFGREQCAEPIRRAALQSWQFGPKHDLPSVDSQRSETKDAIASVADCTL
jgi:hypothetical protein